MTHGALLMTYGSPASLEREDVAAYLARVRGGRALDDELVDEFTRRYRVIGGSSLIEITRRQAVALSAELGWPVAVGMRFSEPSIHEGLRVLAAAGATEVAAVILSPQYSPMLMGGYSRSIDDATASLGSTAPAVSLAGPWHDDPAFIDAIAGRVRSALGRDRAGRKPATHVLMTAHSLPKRVAEREPEYLDQLSATAAAIATAADLSSADWTFCWQSAGHEPGEWMTPDFGDLMPAIARDGRRHVLVVPVQFLADHLETLYDIDVGARQQAEQVGLGFSRVLSLNADSGLVRALASAARRALAADTLVSGLR